jgi:NDP-sugar pyrophosphorylase family protein
MKALLLAAGEGTRLGPVTAQLPKPMLEIGGRPILEHNIRLLARYGVSQLLMNLHYQPETIRDYFGDGSAFGVRITYVYESSLLGTAGAVKNVADHLTETFFVIYADNLTTCDLSRLRAFHKSKGGVATVALFYRENATASGIAEVDAHERVLRFVEKPAAHEVFSPWVNAGILVMEPAVLDFIPAGRPSDFGREVLPALIAAGQLLYGYKMSEGLWWVDSPQDLQRTRQQVEAGELVLP